jgi:DNA repair exonuclease SbcCD ATPase subunit
MLVVKKFGIGGVGPFKDQVEFEVEPGIQYLYGKDLTRGGNGNAAGKSLLASSSAEIFYDTPLVGNKQDRSKSGTRFIEFVKDKELIRISSGFNGRSEALDISIAGNSGTERTKKMTKEAARNLWNISETDYRTYAYLDSQVPHPLVRGSTVERKEFFTSFFRLDILDIEKKIFQAELLKIKKTKAAYQELKSTYDSLSKDLLGEEEYRSKRKALKELEAKLTLLQEKAEEGRRIQRLVDFEAYAGANLKKLKKLVPDLDSFFEIYKDFEKRLNKAKQDAEQLEEYKLYLIQRKAYREKTRGLDMETPLEELEASDKEYWKAKRKLEDLTDISEPQKVAKPSKPQVERDTLVAERASLKHKLEHFQKFKTGVCDTCGQEVKTASPEKVKRRLTEVEAALSDWEEYAEALDNYSAYRKEKKEWMEGQALIEECRNKLRQNKEKSELYKKRSQLVEPVEVEKPEGVEDVEFLRKRFEVLEFCKPHLDSIIALEKLTDKERAFAFDPSELQELQGEATDLRVAIEIHKSTANKAASVKERLEELELLVANEKALELLVDGYAEKAIKKMAIEAISQRLMATVNKYAPLVFDDYHFEFSWGSQISILVHRNGQVPTDVRKLSGAESKLFTLILVLSLLMFVPKAKRLSLLILDEPLASFSEETGELFHRLLPHIQQVIPSILVVTPDARERYEGAKEYTVVKNSKGSKIVQGHPSNI